MKFGLTGIAASTLLLLDSIVGRQRIIDGKKTIEVPLDQNKNVVIHNDFIVIRSEKGINVLSSKCTHLGCNINKVVDGKLLCPCHGSAFSLDGSVIKGPALKSLPILDFELDATGEKLVVTV